MCSELKLSAIFFGSSGGNTKLLRFLFFFQCLLIGKTFSGMPDSGFSHEVYLVPAGLFMLLTSGCVRYLCFRFLLQNSGL